MTQIFKHKSVIGIYLLLALLYAAYGLVRVAQGLGELLKRRGIVAMMCVIILVPSIPQAFTFRIDNNIDKPVLYLLHTDELNIAAGEIEADGFQLLCCDHKPNKYHIIWYDPDEEWGSKASFEIPDTITEDKTVIVSLEFVPLKITIIK